MDQIMNQIFLLVEEKKFQNQSQYWNQFYVLSKPTPKTQMKSILVASSRILCKRKSIIVFLLRKEKCVEALFAFFCS